ncbi:hypothetical protein J6590_001300, partial [Homalodisca vitripennis]
VLKFVPLSVGSPVCCVIILKRKVLELETRYMSASWSKEEGEEGTGQLSWRTVQSKVKSVRPCP